MWVLVCVGLGWVLIPSADARRVSYSQEGFGILTKPRSGRIDLDPKQIPGNNLGYIRNLRSIAFRS